MTSIDHARFGYSNDGDNGEENPNLIYPDDRTCRNINRNILKEISDLQESYKSLEATFCEQSEQLQRLEKFKTRNDILKTQIKELHAEREENEDVTEGLYQKFNKHYKENDYDTRWHGDVRDLGNRVDHLMAGYKEVDEENKKLKNENEEMKEELAQKFYKHYKENDYDLMYLAKTVGPDLGNMVDHLMGDFKKTREEITHLKKQHQRNQERNQELLGFRSVCDSLSLPELTDDCLIEYLNETHETVVSLKEEVEKGNVYEKMVKGRYDQMVDNANKEAAKIDYYEDLVGFGVIGDLENERKEIDDGFIPWDERD